MTQEITATTSKANGARALSRALINAMDNLGTCPHCPGQPSEDDTKIVFACGTCDTEQLIEAIRPRIAAETLRAEAERPARVYCHGVWVDHLTWKFYPPATCLLLLEHAAAAEAQSPATTAELLAAAMANLGPCIHSGGLGEWTLPACGECHTAQLIEVIRPRIAAETLRAEARSPAHSATTPRCLLQSAAALESQFLD